MNNGYDYRECCLKCRYYAQKWCGLHETPTGPFAKCDQYRPIKPTRLK